MAQILVFGDSITYGAWDKKGGWVQRMREFLDEKNLSDLNNYYLIYNLGIDGNTTENLLKRIEFETKQRLYENEEIIFIFGSGVNDSCYVQTKDIFLVSEEDFEQNIQKLIDIARKFSSKIIFVESTPVEEIKVNPLPWSKTGKSYKNQDIRKYNQIMKEVCQKNKIYFIEIFENWIKTDYKKLLKDGVHPNSSGHQKIFEIVKDFLIKNKII